MIGLLNLMMCHNLLSLFRWERESDWTILLLNTRLCIGMLNWDFKICHVSFEHTEQEIVIGELKGTLQMHTPPVTYAIILVYIGQGTIPDNTNLAGRRLWRKKLVNQNHSWLALTLCFIPYKIV